MTSTAHHTGDFLGYPTNRVVGTMATMREAQGAVAALVATGVLLQEIDILNGPQALHRLDPDGSQHGLFARVQRSLLRTAAPHLEFKHLMGHVDDLRAGRVVMLALATSARQRFEIAAVLRQHGGTRIGFYGRWAWESLDADGVDATDARQDVRP